MFNEWKSKLFLFLILPRNCLCCLSGSSNTPINEKAIVGVHVDDVEADADNKKTGMTKLWNGKKAERLTKADKTARDFNYSFLLRLLSATFLILSRSVLSLLSLNLSHPAFLLFSAHLFTSSPALQILFIKTWEVNTVTKSILSLIFSSFFLEQHQHDY